MKAQRRVDATPDNSQDGDVQGQPYRSKDNRSEFGVGLGGYFVKDRLWFYGAYDRVDQKIEFFQTDGVLKGTALPRDVKSDLYSGKLTIRVTDSTTLIGTIFADPQTNNGDLSDLLVNSTNPNSYNAERKLGGTDYAVKLTQLFGTFGVATGQYARHKESYLTHAQGADQQVVWDYTPTLQGGPVFVGGGYGEVFGATRTTNPPGTWPAATCRCSSEATRSSSAAITRKTSPPARPSIPEEAGSASARAHRAARAVATCRRLRSSPINGGIGRDDAGLLPARLLHPGRREPRRRPPRERAVQRPEQVLLLLPPGHLQDPPEPHGQRGRPL